MPAAAVIPTPRVYLNVAAVKKLVVEFLTLSLSLDSEESSAWRHSTTLKSCIVDPAFYFEEIRVFLAGFACIY